jgi:GT2 family glycosyltransferase
MHKGLSVVIPNYNGIGLFPHTLPTVFEALQQIDIPFEVMVVDDCSTDGSIQFLRSNFPDVIIIQNQINSGFSVTANTGVRAAKNSLVLVLNSDVLLEPDYFASQFRHFENESTFGVMGRIIGWDDDIIQDGAKYPSFHSAKIKTSLNYLPCNKADGQNGLYTMYVSGANALFDRSKFLFIGGFNELFSPFYVEDFELSLRAWRLGWKCIYDDAAVCRHKTSSSIKSKSNKWYIKLISNRNKMYLHAIHLDSWWKMLWLVQLIPEVLVQSALGRTYYIKSFTLFIRNLGSVKASRRRIIEAAGGKRLLSVKEVAAIIRGSVANMKVRFF